MGNITCTFILSMILDSSVNMWAYCIYPLMVLLFLPSDLPQMYETVTSFISKDLIFTHPSRHPWRSSKYKYSQQCTCRTASPSIHGQTC